jgi:hypothetical protein
MSNRSVKEMVPPWLFNKEAPRFSISWRMGVAEDYIRAWWDFYYLLDSDDVKKYREAYPEPEPWHGFYDMDHPSFSEEERRIIRKKMEQERVKRRGECSGSE